MPTVLADVLDGSRATAIYQGPNPNLVATWVSVKGGLDVALDQGPKEYAAQVAADPLKCLGFRRTTSLSLGDGELWAGFGAGIEDQPGEWSWEVDVTGQWRKQRLVMAAWEGSRFSVRTHQYGGDVDDLIELMMAFEFTETQNGIIATPRSNDLTLAGDAYARLWIHELGMIEIGPRGSPELPPVPRHAGTTVDGGELYAAGHGDHDQFVLVTPTAVVNYLPYTEDPGAIEGAVGRSSFEWAAA